MNDKFQLQNINTIAIQSINIVKKPYFISKKLNTIKTVLIFYKYNMINNDTLRRKRFLHLLEYGCKNWEGTNECSKYFVIVTYDHKKFRSLW